MSNRPDFKDLARTWLVRVQGHSRAPVEESLGEELRSLYELGAAHAIEVVHGMPHKDPVHGYIDQDETIECIRDATQVKS